MAREPGVPDSRAAQGRAMVSRLIEDWVEMLSSAELPVLARTIAELDVLRADVERVTTAHVVDIVMRDPLMTVKVLQYLQQHRSRRRSADITTIAHALMMLGLAPFFAHFGKPLALEARLDAAPYALHGALRVMSRARHAALYAHDWAQYRRDIDPEEVMVAALLHDLSEMLLWCFAPELALEIGDRQRRDRALRSEAAQLEVIGFRLIDLQLALVQAWQLPQLLAVLMDEHHTHNARVLNVAHAAALARHSAHGWDNLALPHDYAQIGRLLGLSQEHAEQRALTVAFEASGERDWYGVALPTPPYPDALQGRTAG